MAMIVQHNITAMNSNRMLGITTGSQAKSTEKLSSGFKINRAADDAAGLTISEKMRKQIRGLTQASTNAQDGVSSVQTAEGALTEVHSMLQRMNQLATQASNGTNSKGDRDAIQAEIDQLTTEIDRVAETTKFNEIYLLKGDSEATKTVTMQAHDAGLKGKLEVSGDGKTAIFKMDELKPGDTVSIGGKNYTIGATKDDTDKLIADAFAATDKEDIVINGETYKYLEATGNGVSDTAEHHIAGYYKDGTWEAGGAITEAADLQALATDGATVKVGKKELTPIADTKETGVDDVNSNVISADKAYELAAKELLAANQIGDVNGTAYVQKLATAADFKDGDTVTIGDKDYKVGTLLDDIKTAIEAVVTNTTEDGATAKVTIGEEEFTYTYTDATTGGAWTNKAGGDVSLGYITSVYAPTAAAGSEIIVDGTTYTVADDDVDGGSTTISAAKAAELQNEADGISKPNEFKITMGSADVAKTLSFNLHVGADADMTNKIQVDIDTMNSAGLGVKGLNVADDTGMAATYAIDSIQDAISKVSSQRSALGAVQNRLEHTIANVDNIVENTTAAESRIRDTDMAKEMVEYSKNNILAQAGQAMLAQANQSNQGVLGLLG